MTEFTQPIITNRLIVHRINQLDAEFVLELLNSPGWIQFIGDRKIHSLEAAEAYIQKITNTALLYYWVVRQKQNAVPLGIISYMKRDYLDDYDLGFAFLPQFQKQGFAFEAAQAVLAHVMQHGQQKQVLATLLPDNHLSIHLLEKLCFAFTKVLELENETLHVYAYTIQ